MSERANDHRLPPPAFPPGSRKHATHPRPADGERDAYISPDAPMPERIVASEGLGGAFISPDEPIPERHIELAEEFQSEAAIDPTEEGVVVGMDLDPHLEPAELMSGGDPHLMEVIETVDKLSAALHQKGEGALRVRTDMPRFAATLRAYCIGYLVGRRVEDPPPPIIEEPLPTDG
ncbi:MAG: hypothetical protein AAF389_18745 [Gemmatimonadota bacterium]